MSLIETFSSKLKTLSSTQPVEKILLYGFVFRLLALAYSAGHDCFIDHIKYTDIDYHVFTNGSRSLVNNENIYLHNTEYRYSPLISLIFVPNLFINMNFGKLILVISDTLCGYLLYILNIHQGTHRMKSKLFLILWLFSPSTWIISTRGSFEPILMMLILFTVKTLAISNQYILSGLLYGLLIHLKLYPIIYAFTIYIYLINKKPYLKTQTKISYWLNTLKPNYNHYKYFISTLVALFGATYLSYIYYGNSYIEASFLYHLKRLDLQHNFSVYFYLFRLTKNHTQLQKLSSFLAFLLQLMAVFVLSCQYSSFDLNRRVKLRKLTFSLFTTTFIFVSLNKVCTAQYFNWYIIFLPLILDSLKLSVKDGLKLLALWFLSQANWLLFAYLYEYQQYENLVNIVGLSSFAFLLTNLYILFRLCQNYDVKAIS